MDLILYSKDEGDMNEIDLSSPKILIKQRYEVAEFLGYETRNKYDILNAEGHLIGYAAEQQKGIWNFLVRQFMGHWRTFDIHIYNIERQRVLTCKHPFRFFFQRFEVYDYQGIYYGALQQRFSIFTKKFDIEDRTGAASFQMSSPLWKLWTFPIKRGNFEYATIQKKWTGLFNELVTDKDNFEIHFLSPHLEPAHKKVILASTFFIDIQYFERKAGSR
jgi:uncharacterized protein YxjI